MSPSASISRRRGELSTLYYRCRTTGKIQNALDATFTWFELLASRSSKRRRRRNIARGVRVCVTSRFDREFRISRASKSARCRISTTERCNSRAPADGAWRRSEVRRRRRNECGDRSGNLVAWRKRRRESMRFRHDDRGIVQKFAIIADELVKRSEIR